MIALLDSVSCVLAIPAVALPENGPLVVLLPQAVIPFNMILSMYLLGKTFTCCRLPAQGPSLWASLLSSSRHSRGRVELGWGALLVLSCPHGPVSHLRGEGPRGCASESCVSQRLGGAVPVRLSIPMLLLMATVSGVALADLPGNIVDGARCLVSVNSATSDDCRGAAYLVAAYVVFNLAYNSHQVRHNEPVVALYDGHPSAYKLHICVSLRSRSQGAHCV